MTRGSFIVLYGINNLGKSTQAKKLVERLTTEGHDAVYLKYPLYDLAPSGPMLNTYLRGGNPHGLSAREAQLLYVLNRTQYEPQLEATLNAGTHVIAEDYTGTGICWGIGAGIAPAFMEEINSHLLTEDLAFLFTGSRFVDATEVGHKHETDDTLLATVERAHEERAKDNGWITVRANDSIDSIHEFLWQHVAPHIARS